MLVGSAPQSPSLVGRCRGLRRAPKAKSAAVAGSIHGKYVGWSWPGHSHGLLMARFGWHGQAMVWPQPWPAHGSAWSSGCGHNCVKWHGGLGAEHPESQGACGAKPLAQVVRGAKPRGIQGVRGAKPPSGFPTFLKRHCQMNFEPTKGVLDSTLGTPGAQFGPLLEHPPQTKAQI